MRRTLPRISLILAASVAACAIAVAGAAAADDRLAASPSEVLSIEDAQGTIRIVGRGYLNMRVTQGTVTVVDQSPADRFSPYLGGVPRGKSSSLSGRDINMYVLGGRYKVTVRGSGINISARGDGVVLLSGTLDATGSAGTIRIGDLVRPIAEGDAKASFGGVQTGDSSGGGSSSSGSGRS